MTVSNTTYKDTYTGDGADVTFDFNFQIEDESHIIVQVVNSSNTLQTKTINVDYTVSGTGNTNGSTDYTSGTITFTTAPAATDTIIIKRGTPLTQGIDYQENDNFPAETHEGALDKLTLITQDMQEQIDRCFKRDYTGSDTTDFTLPTPVANYYLRFNDAADGLEAVANTGTIGLDNVVEDPSPQLGGNLDVNGNNITSASNGNIIIDPNGTGEIRLNAATVTVEDDIQHAGDSDTKLTFGTDTLTATIGGTAIYDLSSSGIRLGGANARINEFSTDNTLAGGSATAVPTEGAVKTYIDTTTVNSSNCVLQANLDTDGYSIITNDSNEDITLDPHGSGDIILTADTGGWIDLNSDLIYVGQDIIHKGDTDNKITFGTDTQSFETGGTSRLDISDSGVRLGAANARVTTVLDEDTMATDSATALATQQSIKAYVDAKSATQAQMEAASSTTVYTSPGVQYYHPGHPKFWATVSTDGGGTPTLDADYNVTSITDNGNAGSYLDIDINFDITFSNTNYAVVFGYEETGTIGTTEGYTKTRSTTKVRCQMQYNREVYYWVGFGDI